MVHKTQLAAFLLASTFVGSAYAAVTADEAKQLGTTLTLMGSEKAGNADGSIPAYTGEKLTPPAGWSASDPGQRPHLHDDKPLFTITAENYAKYEGKLAEFQKEMFRRYPTFRMDVYPSRRTMRLPQWALDNTVKNATSCQTTDNGLRVAGCFSGVPFPIPKTGNEVMWNKLTFYGTEVIREYQEQWNIPANGAGFIADSSKGVEDFPWWDAKRTTPIDNTDIIWRVRLDTVAPARKAGEKLVLIDGVDMINVGRRAYQYIPGQRRVKLSPDLAYDTPAPTNAGVGTMDDAKLFIGALDRFDFNLKGKSEKFIPYNNFATTHAKLCDADKLFSTKHFPNPDCIRWELHRTWEVNATLKPQFRHVYKERNFYFDEDGYAAGMQESYDAGGKLFRAAWANFYPYYEADGGNGGSTTTLDFQTGAYVLQGAGTKPGQGFWPSTRPGERFFSPEALAGEGMR